MSRLSFLLLLLLLTTCSTASDRSGQGPSRSKSHRRISYHATIGDGAHSIQVVMSLPAGSSRRLWLDPDLAQYVSSPEVLSGPEWVPLDRSDEVWWIPEKVEKTPTVRWTFDLRQAARDFNQVRVAKAHFDAYLSSPSAWLLRPHGMDDDDPISLRVTTPPGTSFSTGLFPSQDGYSFLAEHMHRLPYTVLGKFRRRNLRIGDDEVIVALLQGQIGLEPDDLIDWVQKRAEAVASYYGQFPVHRALVILAPGGRGIASASGNGGAAVYFPLSSRATRNKLERDWVLVHEMVHLAFPQVPSLHNWIDEGLATYVEPLARHRLGLMAETKVWGDLVDGLPQGLPKQGDQGLDRTHTWGRTYWGGALYCLLAELEIRRKTRNQKGLMDALRGILAAGGNISQAWSLERTLTAADQAIGHPVMTELYTAMKHDPYPVDLDGLWSDLGISKPRSGIVFNPSAPLAGIRQSITENLSDKEAR